MSQKKIEKLTPEQEALIPIYREKWRKIALSTEPIDKEKAAEAVKEAYALIGLSEPEILFYASPLAALINGPPLGYQLGNNLEPLFSNQIFSRFYFKIVDQLNSYLLDIIQNKLENNWQFYIDNLIAGELEIAIDLFYIPTASWLFDCRLFDFCISVLSINYVKSEWLIIQSLVKNCFWILPFERICGICDRPRILSFDNQQRLHAEGAPAIQFADGYSLYAYHGVPLPEKYGHIHPNNWQASWLLEEQNAELRRVLIQGIGYERIASELGATELDSFQEYSLLKINSDFDIEPIYMLKMICPSTGYIHVLRVPPDVTSAREAIRWVNWGIDPEEFAVQT